MKLLFALMLSCFVSGAFADETQGVAERLSCNDISARMVEIGAISEPTAEETDELAKLKADYRRMCSKSARGRWTSAEARVTIEPDQTDVAEEQVVEPEEQVVQEEVVAEDVTDVVEVEPMVALEAELANLDAGLCADGSAPNRFGCCGDEIFKDLGNTVFACCPKDGGGDCFPPLK